MRLCKVQTGPTEPDLEDQSRELGAVGGMGHQGKTRDVQTASGEKTQLINPGNLRNLFTKQTAQIVWTTTNHKSKEPKWKMNLF